MYDFPHATDLLLIAVSLIMGGFIAFLPVMDINWSCMVGRHKYSYIGRRSGMVRTEGTRGLVGTTRKLYRCGRCSKDKPAEEEDYE